MLSILNILRKYQEEKKKNKGETGKPDEPVSAIISGAPGLSPEGAVGPGPVENLGVLAPEKKVPAENKLERARELYKELLDWAKKVYKL